MKPHFHLDIETTGIDPNKEDLLQIGVVHVRLKDGFWQIGNRFVIHQGTDRRPESEFAKKHMVAMYDACNKLGKLSPETIRAELNGFFRSCGSTGVQDTFLMGWNASNFDIPFLVNKGILVQNTYAPGPDGKDIMVGDFH